MPYRPGSRIRPAVVTLAAALWLVAPAQGQATPVGSLLDDYARALQTAGVNAPTALAVRPRLENDLRLVAAGVRHPWSGRIGADSAAGTRVRLLPVSVRAFTNSNRPWGFNDGAVWQGRGLTTAFSAGVAARAGVFTAQVAPMLARANNAGFTLSPFSPSSTLYTLSPYAYPTLSVTQSIDAPQRFGSGSYAIVDPGQSFIRADWRGVALGFSTENLWWGPGTRNSPLMSNHAAGFPHAFLGTSGALPIGRWLTMDGRWIWGQLRESGWFDTIPANDRRFITGVSLSFSPTALPGLQFGGTRAFVSDWSRRGADFFRVFAPVQKVKQVSEENPFGNDPQDQLASLFVRWVMPSAGVEVYGEWAKGDHSWDFRDLLLEPEHASGYLLGMQKVLGRRDDRLWRVTAEGIWLGGPRTALARSPKATFFYVHHQIRQGYTNRGQILGAGIGPGSNQQYLGLDRFAPWGKLSVAVQRTGYDNDRFLRQPQPYRNYMEVEPALLANAVVFGGPWDLEAGVAIAKLLNQHYILKNDQTNVNLSLGARYHWTGRER